MKRCGCGVLVSCLAVSCLSPIGGYPTAAVCFSPSEGTCTAAAPRRRRNRRGRAAIDHALAVYSGIPISEKTAALTSTLRSTPSMPEGCAMTLSAVAACSQDVSCSQRTQATIATMAIGTQCCLRLLTSTSSQTDEQFSVLELENAQSAGLGKFPASLGGTDIVAKAGPHTCSCQPHSDNAGTFLNDSGEVEITRRPYSCLSCQQCNHQTTHMKVCSSSLPFICTVCRKVFHKKHKLNVHMRVHSGERPYACSFCQKTFTSKSHMVSHERLHSGERPWICSVCQKSFAIRSNLVRHERLHSGDRPYVCSFCQKTYTNKSHMMAHERLHSGERPYICSMCDKSFAVRSSLVRHERLHSGERPYVCSVCEKTFTTKNDLVTHEELHSGERPWICNICQKSFAKRSNLVRHEKLHFGDRPYMCDICTKSFATSGDLIRHQEMHSDEKSHV